VGHYNHSHSHSGARAHIQEHRGAAGRGDEPLSSDAAIADTGGRGENVEGWLGGTEITVETAKPKIGLTLFALCQWIKNIVCQAMKTANVSFSLTNRISHLVRSGVTVFS